MGTRINKLAKAVSRGVGGESIVDYMGSKIAKYNLRGTPAQKYVTDTTSKKKAALSALSVASAVTAGGLVRKAVAKKALTSFRIPGNKTRIRVEDTTKARVPKGNTVNKANKWTDWKLR